jgi:hypothetical protein
MRRCFISHVVSIIGATNDKSTIYHSISIDHNITQLDFNASKNIVRDLEVFKADLTNIQSNSTVSAIFEASEILEYSGNGWIPPVGICRIVAIK